MEVELNTDVLRQILALVDVHTILALSQASRTLRELTQDRQLWLSLVRDLARRRLIDVPPPEVLDTLSKDALVDEIRRVAAGPRTWSPTYSAVEPPTLTRQFTVPAVSVLAEVELLPGGKHFILRGGQVNGPVRRRLDCWEVQTGRLVWSWSKPNVLVADAKYDYVDAGAKMAILLSCLEGGGSYTVVIIEADLTTGTLEEIFKGPLYAMGPQLCGDFFVCDFVPIGQIPRILLVNWRAGTCVDFLSEPPAVLTYQLFRGHLAIIYRGSTSLPERLRVFPISALSPLCNRTVAALATRPGADLSQIPHTTYRFGRLTAPSHGWPYATAMCVTESLFRADTYECAVKLFFDEAPRSQSPPPTASSSSPPKLRRLNLFQRLSPSLPTPSPPPPTVMTVFRFHIRPSAEGPPKITYRSTDHGTSRHSDPKKYGLIKSPLTGNRVRVGLGGREPGVELAAVDGDGTALRLQITRSNAVLELHGSRVVVSYYK
ncbi:hypothetical protein C8R46DRAFT_1056645 [Mycena filopes]|nr:hypothetical protein C8R46DRAFT_1056645 [Mycena filopes]